MQNAQSLASNQKISQAAIVGELTTSIHQLLQALGDKLKQTFKSKEQNILINYKNQLVEAKKEFEQMQRFRNEEAIKQNILEQKNANEKQCNNYLSQSLQITNTYDNLKNKLTEAEQAERELQLQLKYLHKQFENTHKKKILLLHELQQIENKIKNRQQQQQQGNLMPCTHSLVKNCQQKQYKKVLKQHSKSQAIEKQQNNQNKHKQQRILKNRMEQIKDFQQSIILTENVFEHLFRDENTLFYKTERQRLALIEKILNDHSNKEYLYDILFNTSSNTN